MLAAFADNDPSVAEDRDSSPFEWGGGHEKGPVPAGPALSFRRCVRRL